MKEYLNKVVDLIPFIIHFLSIFIISLVFMIQTSSMQKGYKLSNLNLMEDIIPSILCSIIVSSLLTVLLFGVMKIIY